MLVGAQATRLRIIRGAMLFGVLAAGAAIWYMRRSGSLTTMEDGTAEGLEYAFIGLAIAAVALLLVLRTRLGAVQDPQKLIPLYMIGYAAAEAVALFGAVIWYAAGASEWYVAGIVLMAASFQILPVGRGSS